MMGMKDRGFAPLTRDVSLEGLVPEDHLYRRLEATLDLLRRACFRWRLRPHHATANAIYGTRGNVAVLERGGVRAYVGMPAREFSNKKHFPVGFFRYHPEKDAYTCPANEPLPSRTQDSTSKRRLYRADPE